MTETPPPRITTLDNGLRVISEDMPSLETASVGIWVNAGARCETPDLNGVSHLLEHMAFKGTERRSAREIAEEIEAVGGHLNAYTSREHTAYFAKVLKDDVPLAVDLLADILQNATFDPGELAREQAVVIQEIGQAQDTPDDIVFDHFQAVAYPDQPLGRPVLGTAENVARLTREALAGYMDRHYSAERMVIGAAGRIDHDAFVALAEAAFRYPPAANGALSDQARYVGGDFRSERNLEQTHIVLGLDGLAYDDDDYYALQVFSTLFGGGMSSRLFQEVREQRGLAYSVYSFASSYIDGGLFGIYAGTSKEASAELVEVICEELLKVADRVGEKETACARAQLKSALLMSLESTGARSEQLARQLLIFARHVPNAEIVDKIEAVGAGDIAAVAARLLAASAPTLAALGPVVGLPGYEIVDKRLC